MPFFNQNDIFLKVRRLIYSLKSNCFLHPHPLVIHLLYRMSNG